ncbi:hypothetical protein GH714_028971 [Hevea brasiliensis]|uniref:Uncharacterized protein n=1 Tax=Hevea brasiliensis TaxID=3981 RepID=A0A6A6KNT7_HEVBR|nr:hypothetical protein GH714_028971 [Hevea brasiliensis]
MVKNGLVSNVFSYNMVIDCFCKTSMMDKAANAFKQMHYKGITPNIVTFNTLISGHCKVGEVSKARELLLMLLEHGFKPDIFTFNSIIYGLCQSQQIDDALGCFNEIVEWGVSPNAVTYNILIRSLCVIGDVPRSMKLLRNMQMDGINPDVFSFNALIQSFCRMGKVENAEKLFVSMLSMGLIPDNYTYGPFIKLFCESGRSSEAKEILLSMEANGCVPDSFTCNIILDTLVKQVSIRYRQLVLAAVLVCVSIICCNIGKAYDEEVPQTGTGLAGYDPFTGAGVVGDEPQTGTGVVGDVPETGAGVVEDDPAGIVAKALLCFNEKHIYSSCEEAYRLTENGYINVPHEYVEQYCHGPCLSETHLVLNCIEEVMKHFIFYNKATIHDIRDTIKAGCSYGPERGLSSCDIFNGKWVPDDSDPIYQPGSCPFVDDAFNCFKNGRPDMGYLGYRWRPHGCRIPRFDGRKMLEMLRGKRLVFVGDSLNRNMWESLVCALRESLKNKSRIFEVSDRRELRTQGFYSFRFIDYNCSIDFFKSPFLVQEWKASDKTLSRKETLRLDMIQGTSTKYHEADIIIFNTGHWWTHQKTYRGKEYFQEGSHVYNRLQVTEAYTKALRTWAQWVDANIDSSRTRVFFRGYSASHFRKGQWNSGGHCESERQPMTNDTELAPYPWMMSILESVISEMKTPVFYLNITKMTDYRKDGHPSIYRQPEIRRTHGMIQDCSHWCLPGVPDFWNELLYATLLLSHHDLSINH